MDRIATLGIALFAVVCGGCQGQESAETSPATKQEGTQTPRASGTSGAVTGTTAAAGGTLAPTTTAAPAATAAAAPPAKGYDLSAIKAIPDNCASASVILTSAPKSVGANYDWAISRQALLANQQFRVVHPGPPTSPGEVSLAPYEYGSAYALVARCSDGATCNQLAAMYKAIVRSSRPQPICGPVQGIGASPVAAFRLDGHEGNLPRAQDTIAACARLSACQIATDRATPGDPFLECQKKPQAFKRECAARHPCAEVLACMAQ
ncbi:hypothetical protein [Chondromyces crocatus]|uniref:Uncharacterized protein n=1 Tax=Chondromyces crocatus TaxID=52 RepID=A0A0K1E9W8_CHOCO|nr:hypothetical protein [Chondromyces crocatus]AKT37660.1 uncharacterized protein CMC5_018020 [Chondromyces crocatus]